MDAILKAIQSLLPNISKGDARKLVKTLGLEDAELFESVDDLTEENSMKSVTVGDIAMKLKGLGYVVVLPGMEPEPNTTKSAKRPPYSDSVIVPGDDDEDEDEDDATTKAMNAVYVSRFNENDKASEQILSEVIDSKYKAIVYQQNIAFAKYLRGGMEMLDTNERAIARRQIFPVKNILEFVMNGSVDVRTMKASQIEAQGELGGIAVPPNRQTEIDVRLPGLTAVRGSGAKVVTLVNSNSIDIPKWQGNSDNYIGLLRGTWGTETKKPDAQNFKLEYQPIFAYIYTYKVPMSLSAIEDAANLVPLLMADIASTVSIDEDYAFLTADGIGKPFGILPGGANLRSLREVNSGHASQLTVAGIKSLKRGLPSQYRKGGVFVGNSDTFGLIENFTAGAGTSNWAFPDLSEEDMLLRHKIYESEGMPDVSANTFPLLFANMNGYTIVERLGMAIERFYDSNTGINNVEFQVRKRVGGSVEKPWMFAVQKVSA